MARRAAATLKDIAREVGVSPMAVSTVLHGKRSTVRVSEETRTRILEVAQRLRYRPNAAARGLSQQRMNTVGIVATVGGSRQNLYFMEVLDGILAGSVTARQNATVLPVEDWADEEKILGFCDGRVDGLILVGSHVSPAFAPTLREHIPLVTVQSSVVHDGVPYLDSDNEAGGYLATRYLLEEGHRRILHLAPAPGISGPDLRLQGYRRAFHEFGLYVRPELVYPCARPFFFREDDGYRNTRDFLGRTGRADLPTAIFCASDALAHGCIQALTEQGLRVPDDVSVVGFDDILTAQVMSPPLTTVRQPFREIGKRSVERLMELIHAEGDGASVAGTDEDGDGAGGATPRDIFPVELVVRWSVRGVSG